ncbi:MAG TPA: SIS domain-containing protein [Lacunisphaera sp.]|nr:SIS domain-containing protein [Lacunisphaera sp.]
MKSWTSHYVAEQQRALGAVPPEQLVRLIDLLRRAGEEERQIFTFGNGGSAANATHFATDLGKGASDACPKRFRVLSLTDNVAWMTALGNDYAYEDIFVRQLENFARPGDIAFTMSVSGNSPNLVKAIEWAVQHKLQTVALVGGRRGRLAQLAHEVIVVDSEHYGRVEDIHMTICHILCYALMERP